MIATIVLLAGILIALVPAAAQTTAEQEVRAVVQRVNAAYAANDLEAYFSFYAPDLTQWYPSGRMDLPTYRESWTKYIADGNRIEAADVSDLRVQTSPSGDAAVATYRLRVRTRTVEGEVSTEEFQETDVLFKRDGAWKIVHLHYSPARRRG